MPRSGGSEFDLKQRKSRRKHSDSISERSISCYSDVLSKHGCTDVLCTALFLVFIVVLVFVSIFAYKNGNSLDLKSTVLS